MFKNKLNLPNFIIIHISEFPLNLHKKNPGFEVKLYILLNLLDSTTDISCQGSTKLIYHRWTENGQSILLLTPPRGRQRETSLGRHWHCCQIHNNGQKYLTHAVVKLTFRKQPIKYESSFPVFRAFSIMPLRVWEILGGRGGGGCTFQREENIVICGSELQKRRWMCYNSYKIDPKQVDILGFSSKTANLGHHHCWHYLSSPSCHCEMKIDTRGGHVKTTRSVQQKRSGKKTTYTIPPFYHRKHTQLSTDPSHVQHPSSRQSVRYTALCHGFCKGWTPSSPLRACSVEWHNVVNRVL